MLSSEVISVNQDAHTEDKIVTVKFRSNIYTHTHTHTHTQKSFISK
jgi:hypothetical protein